MKIKDVENAASPCIVTAYLFTSLENGASNSRLMGRPVVALILLLAWANQAQALCTTYTEACPREDLIRATEICTNCAMCYHGLDFGPIKSHRAIINPDKPLTTFQGIQGHWMQDHNNVTEILTFCGCGPGKYANVDKWGLYCGDAPIGYYYGAAWHHTPLSGINKCPEGFSTKGFQSKSIADCDECDFGYVEDGAGGCTPCPAGRFRNVMQGDQCADCPAGS